jgi:hypothetical protein
MTKPYSASFILDSGHHGIVSRYPLDVYPVCARCLGIVFYREAFHCDEVEVVSVNGDPTQMSVRPLAPLQRIRGSWWRRAGYAVLSRLGF